MPSFMTVEDADLQVQTVFPSQTDDSCPKFFGLSETICADVPGNGCALSVLGMLFVLLFLS
jgi:hypothetical protein